MPAERRRSLWLEPLPAVELAERLLRLPIFSSVSVDDLFRLARSGRQVRWEMGQELCHEGARPDAAHFLLDGSLVAVSQAGAPRPINAPAEVAFDEVLEGCAVGETVRAVESSICLALTSDEVAALLADNAALVDGLVRHWAAQAHGPDGIILDGQDPGAVERLPANTLAPAQEAIALGQVPAFDGVDTDELLALADAARQVSLAAGTKPFEEIDTSACYVVVSGRMLVAQPAGAPPLEAGPGDAVGVYQMLRGVAPLMPVHVPDACRALRIDRDAFIDVLGRRPVLLRQLFGVLYRQRAIALAGAGA
jgi:CRP-like cAMP-binding protein